MNSLVRLIRCEMEIILEILKNLYGGFRLKLS